MLLCTHCVVSVSLHVVAALLSGALVNMVMSNADVRIGNLSRPQSDS